jgi:photosystem II stability/assembly factor-like uncharacterized protein
MRVRMNLRATTSLKKGSVITLSKMTVMLTSNATPADTIRDTITPGEQGFVANSTTDQIIDSSYALKALRAWKIQVTVRDSRDSLIHFDTASTPMLAIGDLVNVNLGLTSRFAMYDATFQSLPDSISALSGNVKQVLRVNRLVLKVDGVALRDSLATPGPYFTELMGHTLGYDYVSTATKTVISSGVSANLNSVFFTSASNGVLVGAGGTVHRTVDGGATWNAATTPGGTKALRSVFFLNATHGWAVGDSSAWRTVDGGATWSAQTASPFNHLFKSVHFVTTSIGWAVTSGAYRSVDGGATWTPVFGTPTCHAIRFATPDTGWAVGVRGGNTTIRKTVTGTGDGIWLDQTVVPTQTLRSVFPINSNLVYAVGDTGTILRTVDGGANWIAQTTGVPSQNLKSVHFLDAAVGYAVGDNGTILATSDSGNNWAVQSSPVTANLTSIHFIGTKAYVVGENGTLFSLTGPRLVTLEVYGPMGSWSGPLFSGSKYINVAAGVNVTIPLTLKWVGPSGGTGSISATLGKVGKVTINGTLPGTILP